MKKWTLKAKVQDEKIMPETPSELYEAKRQLEGEDILLAIQKWYLPRTGKQNRYYWGMVVQMICDDTGEDDPEYIHEYLKKRFAPEFDVLGEKIKKSTSQMSTQEFEEYMAKIRMWASRDLHIYIPKPNEAPGFAYEI